VALGMDLKGTGTPLKSTWFAGGKVRLPCSVAAPHVHEPLWSQGERRL